MEFKKCARCGCFYMSEDDVCVKCYPKDMEVDRLLVCLAVFKTVVGG